MNDTNTSQRINFYAAFGVGLVVSLVVAIVFFAGVLLSSQLLGHSAQPMLLMLIFLGAVLFFGLAALLGSKYGWRTVVTSLIVQGFVLTAVLYVATVVLQPPRYNYGNDSVSPSLVEPW